MNGKRWILSLLSLMLTGAVFAWAEKPPSTQPTDGEHAEKTDAKATKSHRAGLVKPYSDLTTLTDEQVVKIKEIHRKAVADRKAIEDKEEADTLALLTDEQKAELDKMSADKKAKAAEKRAAKKDEKKDEEDGDKK